MARRKKRSDFNQIIVIAAVFVFGWIGLDYYFNVRSHPQTEDPVPQNPVIPAPASENIPAIDVAKEPQPEMEDGFKLETYRDDRGKFEFKYPVYYQSDPDCPKLAASDNGFTLGVFSFSYTGAEGELADFINTQLEGMEISQKEAVTVAGVAASKIDYQTPGMGWYGSEVFLANGDRFYEFGILANTSSKCGGVQDYEDRVYRSVINTLKFTQ